MTAKATEVFIDAVHLVGDALGVEFDEVVCEAGVRQDHRGRRPRLVEHHRGLRGRHRRSWHGKINGRSIVELRFVWRKGQTLEPDWPIDTGHRIKVDGRPQHQT